VVAAATTLKPVRGPLDVALAVTVVVWLSAEFRQAIRRRPEAVKADRGSLYALRAAYVVAALLATLSVREVPAAAIRPEALASWVGLVILWCGIALRLWSFWTLGRYFTYTVQTSADQPVITSGPYRPLRHPSYTGILLLAIGLGFLTGNWLSLVTLAACVVAGLVYRIRVEERALLETLGERYRDYASSRKRLIPLVW
jgi:protein-S-isoprenylcysteine O-methyltransferase Ste14